MKSKRQFGNNARVSRTDTLPGDSQPKQVAAFGRSYYAAALEAACVKAEKRAEFRAQHGPVIRIDPVTGARTVIA